ncbi:MAG TPA: NAD-dependent epimerase/dehydratase family protein [Spirochaetia bacterium]|nr:NAD-dependent epimerase/dehydratase family protein [Spirochaetia bacterium]
MAEAIKRTEAGGPARPGLQVVFGTGPVGCAAAGLLLERGLRVRMVNRTGKRPSAAFWTLATEQQENLELVGADAMDVGAVLAAAKGATHIYSCVNVAYQDWQRILPIMHANIVQAAADNGAVLAAAENLYMYARGLPVIDEKAPVNPPSRKGALVQRLHEKLIEAGAKLGVQWTAVRASDFYGPLSTGQSLFGTERFLAPLFSGNRPLLWGNLDMPHTFTYVEDYGRALAIAALSTSAHGSAWIVPNDRTVTTRQLAHMFFEAAGLANGRAPRIQRVPRAGFAVVGLFNPLMREVLEVLYQKEERYVVDGSKFRDTFDFQPTPLEDGVRRTLAWYRSLT